MTNQKINTAVKTELNLNGLKVIVSYERELLTTRMVICKYGNQAGQIDGIITDLVELKNFASSLDMLFTEELASLYNEMYNAKKKTEENEKRLQKEKEEIINSCPKFKKTYTYK